MAVESWSAEAWADAMTTDLNSLANNGQITKTSATLDNETGAPYTLIEFEFTAGGSIAATSGALIIAGLVPLMSDGSNYPTGTDGTTTANHYQRVNYPHCAISFQATTVNPFRQKGGPIPLPPGTFRFFAVNFLGAAFPASGNVLRYRRLRGSVV